MSTLLFPFMFLLLASLLLWIIIGLKGWPTAKMWLINITAFFVIIFWLGVKSYMGWPADEILPSQMRLVYFMPNEPESLYVLGEECDEVGLHTHSWYDFFFYNPKDKVRMFKIEYCKNLHKKLEQAMEEVNKGGYVLLSRKELPERELFKGEANEGSIPNMPFNAYILPPDKIIKKP